MNAVSILQPPGGIPLLVGLLCIFLGSPMPGVAGAGINEPVEVHAMAPLRIVDPRMPGWKKDWAWDQLRERLDIAKFHKGASAITVDVWCGLVQADGPDRFDWEYYERIFSEAEARGLKVIPILSMHQCGGNIGDDVYIPNPSWFREAMRPTAEHGDLAYLSESGNRNDEAVSAHATEYFLPHIERFYTAFRDHFSDMARRGLFPKVIPGMGPAGELVYPSYHSHDRADEHEPPTYADFPGRGVLQASSEHSQRHLQKHLKAKYASIEALNRAWGSNYSDFSHIYMLRTTHEVDSFLEKRLQYSQRGQDFFEWYHHSLLEHGRTIARLTTKVFHAPGSAFLSSKFGFKIPGIHWQFLDRFPQLAAGLISTAGATPSDALTVLERQPSDWSLENGNGYRGFFEHLLMPLRREFPQTDWLAIFTCGELPNCPPHCLIQSEDAKCSCCTKGRPALSRAEDLVHGFLRLAEHYDFKVVLENALAMKLYDEAALDILYRHIASSPSVAGVSLLRLPQVVDSPHVGHFIHRLRSLQQAQRQGVTRQQVTCPRRLVMLSGSGGLTQLEPN